ncbi:hypothetical protein [Paraburkholderia hospita]|uniref:hypothetical protein n=1 Tax=Paraburkholderia hospita TaxID=169430 RepID=UPI000271C732|nr:hypothetical protein [Paraburkholderia hospita]EUC14328.1 hypothetical protein PMI06_006739 [Burkholderia sp. BT03]SKC93637.1 hypothetical protein SAMN06266956_5684 [Paraburkholderia hospita]
MKRYTTLVLTSGNDAMENAVGELIQSRIGGPLLRVDVQRRASADPEPSVIRVRPDRLDEMYCTVATTRHACSVIVSAQCVPSVLAFLEEHEGTAGDFTSIICTATPRAESQSAAMQTIERLIGIGADPAKLGVIFTQAPRELPMREAFSQLANQLSTGQFPNVNLETMLPTSTAFERARELQLPVPAS